MKEPVHTQPRSSATAARSLALVVAVLAGSRLAHADTTTGLWPGVGGPLPLAHAEASKDAALVVGIDQYDALPRVVGAADMARDWEKYFLFGRRVAPERLTLLTDRNATVDEITTRAKELSSRVPEGGTLFIVFIGHGAPGEGGQRGLLLGADARPSEGSFAKRSISYDDLKATVAGGSQARTVMILDACFSGVDTSGKTLLPNVQPVVAARLVASAHMTVFSAGRAGEYAGALPGSQRPALSYLLLGALRGWADSDGNGAVTAKEAQAYASLVLRSLPNNHEQHPELVTDAEDEPLETSAREKSPDLAEIRSKLDTWRPPAEKKAAPKLRLAVSCGDDMLRRSADALDVYLDGSPTALVSSGADRRLDAGAGTSILEAVEYPITEGPHHLLVHVAGCEPAETEIHADGTTGAEVRGTLKNSSSFARGPAGTPDWWRIGLAAWGTYIGDSFRGPPSSAIGGMVQPELVSRWFSAGVDLGFAHVMVRTPDAQVSRIREGVQAGLRLPLHSVALGLGIHGGTDQFVGDAGSSDITKDIRGTYWGGWLSIDLHVSCDVPLFAGASYDANAGIGVLLGVAFQPNKTCSGAPTTYGVSQR